MGFDWGILQAIQDYVTCTFLDVVMPIITAMGNIGAIWIIAAVALLCTKKYRVYGVVLLGCLAVGALIGNGLIKNAVMRPRPCWLDESVTMLIATPSDYSFPSGHTMASVIGATILTAANRKFGLIAIPLAVLIAFSRMYLYVHFPSDILGGLVLGLAISAAGLWISRRYRARYSA